MGKVKIVLNGKEEDIVLDSPKGKHQTEFFKLVTMTANPETALKAVTELDLLPKNMIVELSNGRFKNLDEVNELPVDELNKLINDFVRYLNPSEPQILSLIKNSLGQVKSKESS
jgi:hypothetical protein